MGTVYLERYLMNAGLKKLPAIFYRSKTGREPVRDWLKEMPSDERRIVGFDVAEVELGWPIDMPLCRSLGNGLWEVRSNLPNRIARVIFCVVQGNMVLLHGFIKKTQKTPPQDLEIARNRQKEVER